MIRSRIFYIIGLIGLFLFYMFCDSYTPFAIIVVLVSLTVLGIVGTAASRSKISLLIQPKNNYMTQAENRKAEFCITIKNNSFFPISAIVFDVEFQDLSEKHIVKRTIKTAVAAKEERKIYTIVTTSHSAAIECRVTRAMAYDSFGLAAFKLKNLTTKAKMIIMPIMSDSSYLKNQQSSYIIDSDKFSETQKGDDSSQVFEVRDYVPGDDIRKIHWRLSSKQDNLIVKEYSKPVNENCLVLLETGFGAVKGEDRKKIGDQMLSVFMKLAFELIESEQEFSVYRYSEQARRFAVFNIKNFDDVSPAADSFLSERFPEERNISYRMSEIEPELLDKQIYYLYNSACSDSQVIECLPERFCAVDTIPAVKTRRKGSAKDV